MREAFFVAVALAGVPDWLAWFGGALLAVAVAVPGWLWWTR